MKSNARRLVLLLMAIAVLAVTVFYAVRTPGPQWSSFMAGVGFAALVYLVFRTREEEW